MGIFDRFMPKKDAPSEASVDPSAPPTGAETPPNAPPPASPINMDEANRLMNNAAQSINEGARTLAESAKPLGESLKPLGQSLIADLSSAGRDLSGAINNLTSPSSAPPPTPAASPAEAAPYPPTSQTPPSAYTAPTESTVSSVVTPPTEPAPVPVAVQTPPVTVPPAPEPSPAQPGDDALPLPDAFDPFTFSFDNAPTTTPDSTTSESSAYANSPVPPSVVSPPVVSPAISPVFEPLAPSDALDAEGNLEEYHEPLPTLAPSPLANGTQVSLSASDGSPVTVTVTEALSPRGNTNCYRAHSAVGVTLLLREAAQNSEAAARMERENSARRTINSPQIPLPAAYGTSDDRVYLADATSDSEKTFASQLQQDAPLADLISTLTQTSAALSGLHRAGFVHGAVRPEAIILGKPVRLSGFESLSPIGQKSTGAASFAGYGAPEIIAGETLDARTDIYSVGALLHRIVTGAGVAETGWDASTFAPQMLLPGAPQILAKTLGPAGTRYSDMSALHRDLVRLRARLRPLARHQSVGETTIGLEWGRTTNQDAWGELRGHKQGEDGAVEWTAWVVSDGMGGMASGEVASQVAVSAVLKEAASWGAGFAGGLVAEADQAQIVKTWTREANRQAVDAMNNIGARGGCTLVCGLIVDKRLTLAHVGDCRVYLWRGGELTQLTRDHSYVMSLVLQGEITREQMRDHPDRSKITRSLGDRHPMPDYFVDGLEVETQTPSLELQAGDTLLAFSDGVWEPVLEDEMKSILTSAPSLDEAAHQLVEAAMREGGPDNATVYLFKMGEAAPVAVNVG
ncbi:protein phosphatase PrpC [Abditibacteriota bacterium]|nr:protein phosphatase PrpC [Abditibacteriota bacterium]